MNERKPNELGRPQTGHALWPDKQYYEKLDKLRTIIGQEIYLIEAVVTDINAGIHHSGKPCTLLSIVDYPRPDPKTGLLPHTIIIDDGRGINLGRIIQISTGSAFKPAEQNILFRNDQLLTTLLPQSSRLDKKSLAQTSKALLASALGKTDPEPAEPHPESGHIHGEKS